MADEEEVIIEEPVVDPKVEAEAVDAGWVPKDKYRGDPEKWVDAKTYVEKAHIVMPILRKKNQELHSELAELRQQDAQRAVELKALKTAFKAIEETQEEDLAERVVVAKADLEEQIAVASEAGDHRRVAKLTSDMVELVTAEKMKGAKVVKEETPLPKTVPVTAEHKAWANENEDWFEKDQKKTRMALAFGQAIAAEGLKGDEFYDELDKRLDKYYGEGKKTATPDSKVAGGRGSPANGDGGEGAVASYSDLPKEAKETCERLSRRMVGEGKPHKDIKSWRASYTRQFNA